MSQNDAFKSALKTLYTKDPCKVLPTAIWKTIRQMDTLQCASDIIKNNISKIIAQSQNTLEIFWTQDRKIDDSFRQSVKSTQVMIVHDDYFQQINTETYSSKKAYFRISHQTQSIKPCSLDKRYYITEATPETESDKISTLIGKCYKNIHPSAETVLSWTAHHVYDKSLWIWIMDKKTGQPAALGIAEYDATIPEGSLEWIQVLPEYQGKGLGKVLVLELLNRLQGRVTFTTVSGEIDNQTNPERLYRGCGFLGEDVWWVLRK